MKRNDSRDFFRFQHHPRLNRVGAARVGTHGPRVGARFTAGSPAVRSLVELKASVESRDAKGWSLLFYACDPL